MMATANGTCSKTLASGSVVLMARIVDGSGAAIRPSDVVAIEYSVHELDPFWPEQLTVVRGHRAVPLAVCDVLFESLQVGCGWSLDGEGYNFRHEIPFVREQLLARTERGYEVAYELTMIGGRRTIVRFSLRSNCVP